MDTLSWDQLYILGPDPSCRPPGQLLTELPLVILVGLTGAGKSTSLTYLASMGVNFSLLPNRRAMTDEMIISALQREAGELPQPVTDRLARFAYTARYRTKYPGGLAYALSQLAVDPTEIAFPLIFDGLRGLEEVQQASHYFPQGRFVLLDAPDTVRLSRLLQRGDAFDAVEIALTSNNKKLIAALQNIPGIDTTFKPEQLGQIAHLTQAAQLAPAEVIKKVSIIVEERRNYDSQAARAYLLDSLPSNRILVVDTEAHRPEVVAAQIAAWLRRSF
jgi:hypothetical protein